MNFISLWIATVGFGSIFAIGLVSTTTTTTETPQVGPRLSNGGKIWALLVAGSNGYGNYRHQADVCHAYQILHQNGIPDENIIVMMYDDIARNPENPTPNVIINRPNGTNVYEGVPIDYSGDLVNSTNFLAVLNGDEETVKNIGSGKVIKSGPKDHIFVNFVDHGAPGFLCFPNDELYARTLERTFIRMLKRNRFDKMVLYVEACESGSMFDSILPDNENIFVMTAADPQESSYACYFDEIRQTYLGDVFSVKWMEDSETADLTKESLHHLFEQVRSDTNTSHVEEYGDLDIGSLPVASFLGATEREDSVSATPLPAINDAVSSRDVHLEILKRKLNSITDEDKKKELHFQIHTFLKLRRHLDQTMWSIAIQVAHNNKIRAEHLMSDQHRLRRSNLNCYESLVRYFSKTCFKLSENQYALSKMHVLVNMCSEDWIERTQVYRAMDRACGTRKRLTGIL